MPSLDFLFKLNRLQNEMCINYFIRTCLFFVIHFVWQKQFWQGLKKLENTQELHFSHYCNHNIHNYTRCTWFLWHKKRNTSPNIYRFLEIWSISFYTEKEINTQWTFKERKKTLTKSHTHTNWIGFTMTILVFWCFMIW